MKEMGLSRHPTPERAVQHCHEASLECWWLPAFVIPLAAESPSLIWMKLLEGDQCTVFFPCPDQQQNKVILDM